jgi:hypothetical protein
MHLFSFENEEDKDIGGNKCRSDLIYLVESIFCPMTRIPTGTYADKWKNLPKKTEHKLVIGKLYTTKEANVIKRLQAHNVVACTFKTIEKTVKT